MIEIIYNETGKKGSSVVVKPPKNIRQIGSPRGRHKIYVEDYVYTFLHSTAFEGECQKRGAILLGRSEISQDIRYTFISGAISCDDFIFRDEGILFDESCWEYIYKEIKQYFDNQEIVGWFLGLTGFPMELTPMVESCHRKYFAGRDKVLFLSEPSEGEDVFFAFEQGILQKKEGYYIYYEKNLPMQEYMVSSRERSRTLGGDLTARAGQIPEEGSSLDAAFLADVDEEFKNEPEKDIQRDAEPGMMEREPLSSAEQAIQNYRSMILERKESRSRKKMNGLLYTAAASAMVILCVIGITTLNNYEKMKGVEEALAVMSGKTLKEDKPINEGPGGVVVESVPGQVTPEQENPDNTALPNATDSPSGNPQGTDTPSGSQQNPTEGQPGATGSGSTEGQPDAGSQVPAEGQPPTVQQEAGNEPQSPENPGSTTPPDAAETSAQAYLDQGYYVVQPGDKMELICKKIYQNTDMLDKLCEANQIDDVNKIYPGQKLTLP